MVVGTHLDEIPAPQRTETIERLTSLFAREYLDQVQETMTVSLDPHLRLVNTLDNACVQSVRDAIYDCALSYCPSLSRSEYWRSCGEGQTNKCIVAGIDRKGGERENQYM